MYTTPWNALPRACRAVALICLLALLVAGCGQPAPAAAPSAPSPAVASGEYWPTDGWRTSTPEAQHMDGQKLAALLQEVRDTGLDLHSLLIIRNGYLV